jgi:hypothetical protein
MKDLAKDIIIVVLLIALVVALAVTCVKYSQSERERKNILQQYNALYAAKTKTDTIIIRDTLKIEQDPITIYKTIVDSVFVTDTVYTTQPLMDRTYQSTLTYGEDISVGYNITTRGWLMGVELTPVIPVKHIHTQHITTEYITNKVYPTFSIGGGIGIPKGWYVSGAYHRGRIAYRGTYLNINDQNHILAGAEISF